MKLAASAEKKSSSATKKQVEDDNDGGVFLSEVLHCFHLVFYYGCGIHFLGGLLWNPATRPPLVPTAAVVAATVALVGAVWYLLSDNTPCGRCFNDRIKTPRTGRMIRHAISFVCIMGFAASYTVWLCLYDCDAHALTNNPADFALAASVILAQVGLYGAYAFTEEMEMAVEAPTSAKA